MEGLAQRIAAGVVPEKMKDKRIYTLDLPGMIAGSKYRGCLLYTSIRRFYEMGFNIEATVGTGEFLKAHGIRTRIRRKLSENSTEILEAIRSGYVSYVINTRAILSGVHYEDGLAIRRTAIENNVTMFTSLDTVKVLLDVLEEITIGVSPLYA